MRFLANACLAATETSAEPIALLAGGGSSWDTGLSWSELAKPSQSEIGLPPGGQSFRDTGLSWVPLGKPNRWEIELSAGLGEIRTSDLVWPRFASSGRELATRRFGRRSPGQTEPPNWPTETNEGIGANRPSLGRLWFGTRRPDPPRPREIAGFFGAVANSYREFAYRQPGWRWVE